MIKDLQNLSLVVFTEKFQCSNSLTFGSVLLNFYNLLLKIRDACLTSIYLRINKKILGASIVFNKAL